MAKGRDTHRVPVDSLIPNPRNDRVHDDTQRGLLLQSLHDYGQTRPLLVRKENRMIIAGHGVWETAKAGGVLADDIVVPPWTDIEVMFLDVDQDTADRILLVDNRTSELGTIDDDRRAALLEQFGEDSWGRLGFSDEEVVALLGAPGDSIEVREVDTGPVDDTFWISISGPLRDQARALQRLQHFMAEFPDVAVELGTTAI